MAGEAAAFDGASEQFLSHYGQVRGHVRLRITQNNLVGHLMPGALEVLDYQGGAGHDTIWIASMGDRPTLLEESPKMFEAAETNIKEQKANIRSRIKLLPGNLEELPEDASFDVILSHGVLMYELGDPQGQLDALASRLKERGILSLLTKGKVAASSQVKEEDLAGFKQTARYVNRLGRPARAYEFDELEAMLAIAGLSPVARYGVRLLSDDDQRSIDEVPDRELEHIVSTEIEAGSDPALMDRGQMLHVIARKE